MKKLKDLQHVIHATVDQVYRDVITNLSQTAKAIKAGFGLDIVVCNIFTTWMYSKGHALFIWIV